MQRWTLQIKGKVQGVFYRKYSSQQAQSLGLTGFVRNRSDGSVELVAEGDEPSLQALLDWCREGSPRAQVATIDIEKAQAGSPRYSEFSVRNA